MLTQSAIQNFFHADYSGTNQLLTQILEPIFGEYDLGYDEITKNPTIKDKAKGAHIKTIKHVATFWAEGLDIKVFDVTLEDNCRIHIARKNIQLLVREYVEKFEGAFIVFHYENTANRSWRLSYLEKRQNTAASTNAKRYTYLCGKDYPCRTIAERFYALQSQDLNAINLEKAFSVEALSDEFFTEYTAQYNNICNYIYDNREDATRFGEEFADCEDKFIRDYVKKMMGRITFLHFLQKKGWMGVPLMSEWGQGDVNFMRHLFEYATPEQQENFLDEILEPLFFDCLNSPRNIDEFDTHITKIGKVRIPYLNGGLFEKDDIDKPQSTLPSQLFKDLLDFYARFNFTIDENDPLDAEVGVDPEMLGKIFENLLEDNKDKGAFYTPKEIVNYMCKESLIAYLITEAQQASKVNKQRQENFEAAIRALVEDPEMTVSRIKRYDEKQLEVLSKALMEVKICDPAIGSGAFPMGLLNLLFKCRNAVNNALGQSVPPAELKKDIIRNNIYGVDIEKGAIDIARLRFWLSIVVDLEEPEALPNFDYKFMQGNSLLEQFAGVDLSDMFATKATEGKGSGVQLISFDEVTTSQSILQERLRHYFGMRTGEDKHLLREKVNQAVADLISAKVNEAPELVSQLQDLDVSANDQFFLWHTWFAEVFNRPSKQGFDIVIGNPPYLFLSGKGSPVQKLKREGKEEEATVLKKIFDTYKREYPEASSGCCDLYKWFFALSVRLVRQNGIVSYITPDTYFNLYKYADIRNLLFSNSIGKVIDLGFKVFKEPCVSSSIIVLKKDGISARNIMFADLKNTLTWYNRDKLADLISDGGLTIGINNYTLNLYKHPIAEKIYLDSEGKYVTASYYIQITEGEHNIQKVDLIQTSKTGYLPVLLDGEMSKYSLVAKAYTPSNIDIGEIHKGERCILRKTGDSIVVSIPHDFTTAIAHQNVYIVKTIDNRTSILFWFAILNSKLLTFLYQNGLYGQKGRQMAQFRKYALDILPIPANLGNIEKTIVNIAKKLVEVKQANPQADTCALEKEIDNLVYLLYELTPEEIAMIEQAT